jgi:predicted nucleic acid-binding protein
MILIDTSVWVDHLRLSETQLVQLLGTGMAAIHPFVIGELACGNLKSRAQLLSLLQSLPQIAPAMDHEVMLFIENKNLMGRGIGYIDAHLLAATALAGNSRLWTRDKRLHVIAKELQCAFVEVAH